MKNVFHQKNFTVLLVATFYICNTTTYSNEIDENISIEEIEIHSNTSSNNKNTVEVLEENNPREQINLYGTKIKSSSVYLDDSELNEKQSDHLCDILRSVPGVDVGGTHATNQRINIRGQDDTDLNISIDNVNQNTFMYHHMGNLQINADILKSANISVGTNSITHHGLGGSVEFTTKDPSDFLFGDKIVGSTIRLRYLSNNGTNYALYNYGIIDNKFDFLTYAFLNNHGNHKDGEGMENYGSKGITKNGIIKLGYRLSPSQRISFSYDAFNDRGKYSERPDLGIRGNEAITGKLLHLTNFYRDTITLNYDLNLGKSLISKVTFYRNNLDLNRIHNTTKVETQGIAVNKGIKIKNQSKFGDQIKNILTYGAELNQGEQKYISPNQISSERNESTVIYIEDSLMFPVGLEFIPGVKYNAYTKETASGKKDSWNKISSALAINYEAVDDLVLSVSTTQLFKGPEMSEVFIGSGGTKKHNPTLKPETGANKEAGIRYSKNLSVNSTIKASFRYFETEIKDKIAEEDYPHDAENGRGAPVWDNNLGKVKIKGHESSIYYSYRDFNTLLTYSHSSSLNIKTGHPLDRELGDSVNLSLNYYLKFFDVFTSWHIMNQLEKTNVAAGADPKKGYTVHNLSLRWQPRKWKNTSIIFGIDNIFDEHYASHASRTGTTFHPVFGNLELTDYEPGRNFKLTIAENF